MPFTIAKKECGLLLWKVELHWHHFFAVILAKAQNFLPCAFELEHLPALSLPTRKVFQASKMAKAVTMLGFILDANWQVSIASLPFLKENFPLSFSSQAPVLMKPVWCHFETDHAFPLFCFHFLQKRPLFSCGNWPIIFPKGCLTGENKSQEEPLFLRKNDFKSLISLSSKKKAWSKHSTKFATTPGSCTFIC